MRLSSMSISKSPPIPSKETMLLAVPGPAIPIPSLDYSTTTQSASNVQQSTLNIVLPPIGSIFMRSATPINPTQPNLNIGPIPSSTNPIVAFRPSILTTAISATSPTPKTIIPSTLAPVSPVSTIPAVRASAVIAQPIVAVTQVTASSAGAPIASVVAERVPRHPSDEALWDNDAHL